MELYAMPAQPIEAPPAALWTPDDEPSLDTWLEAEDVDFTADSWQDRANPTRVFTDGSFSQDPDGDIRFDSNSTAAVTSGMSTQPNIITVAVMKPSVGTPPFFTMGINGGGTIITFRNNADLVSTKYGNGQFEYEPAPAGVRSVVTWFDPRADGLAMVPFINGIALNSTGISTPSSINIDPTIARKVFSGNTLTSLEIFESRSIDLRFKAEGYAAHKHGITLHPSHPYADAPPTI